jgi:hypothetical protein
MAGNHIDVFVESAKAVARGDLIKRENARDKEFHFQNWFQARLTKLKLNFDPPGRNAYPDFRLVKDAEGYETKGLGYPGREVNYDCNSQVPSGRHNGRTIYYVFGRYPADPGGDEFPVLDLVLCHGDFLNAHRDYKHKNASFTAFGSYGDIMIRDRKMYVAPTPFALTKGTARQSTLILQNTDEADGRLRKVGHLIRTETAKLVAGYSFDMRTNRLKATLVANPTAGRQHVFAAYRLKEADGPTVAMAPPRLTKAVEE